MSCVERSNLSIRIGNMKFTRLTIACSEKAADHAYAMALYFKHYNFIRIHQTLCCAPAMAGVRPRNSGK
jgi:hypothetical protein